MSSFASCARRSTLRQTDVQRRNGLAHLSGSLPKLYKMKSQALNWTTIAAKSSMNDQRNGMMVRTLPCHPRNFLELSPASCIIAPMRDPDRDVLLPYLQGCVCVSDVTRRGRAPIIPTSTLTLAVLTSETVDRSRLRHCCRLEVFLRIGASCHTKACIEPMETASFDVPSCKKAPSRTSILA